MANVVVIGSGNAGMNAALSAQESGADVTVLEAAQESEYGSDSFFSGGLFRVAYSSLAQVSEIVGDLGLDGAEGLEEFAEYDESEFLDDWGRVTGYRLDPEISDHVVANSYEALKWMSEKGVPFASPLMIDENGRVRHSRPGWHGGFLEVNGAGVGLCEALLKAVRGAGIETRFGREAIGLERGSNGAPWVVTARLQDGGIERLEADSVIIASGGFQANTEWRTMALGPGWDLAKVRGSKHNNGGGLRMAMEQGAKPVGNWSGCHAVAWSTGSGDAGRPSANHVFERESHPFGITVNVHGERFLDEGEDFGAYTYAKYGKVILSQPNQIAWQIFDAKTKPLWTSEYHYKNPEAARIEAPSLEVLAQKLASRGLLSTQRFMETVEGFNAAVGGDVEFNPYVKDGKATEGLGIEKTNWSQELTEAPFYAFEITCGITFTFGGLKVDTSGRVLNSAEQPIDGLFAIGEAVGGLYYFNYASGTGLTAGAVLGRDAGRAAAAR